MKPNGMANGMANGIFSTFRFPLHCWSPTPLAPEALSWNTVYPKPWTLSPTRNPKPRILNPQNLSPPPKLPPLQTPLNRVSFTN